MRAIRRGDSSLRYSVSFLQASVRADCTSADTSATPGSTVRMDNVPLEWCHPRKLATRCAAGGVFGPVADHFDTKEARAAESPVFTTATRSRSSCSPREAGAWAARGADRTAWRQSATTIVVRIAYPVRM